MKFTQFASGLHEVLGLTTKDGWIYATQRAEETRMKDLDGDRRADVFETVGDPWGINGDYHEYAFGSKFDKDGNLWMRALPSPVPVQQRRAPIAAGVSASRPMANGFPPAAESARPAALG